MPIAVKVCRARRIVDLKLRLRDAVNIEVKVEIVSRRRLHWLGHGDAVGCRRDRAADSVLKQ